MKRTSLLGLILLMGIAFISLYGMSHEILKDFTNRKVIASFKDIEEGSALTYEIIGIYRGPSDYHGHLLLEDDFASYHMPYADLVAMCFYGGY